MTAPFAYTAAPSPEELAGFPLNDLGNAMRLIRLVGGTLDDDGAVGAARCELLYLRDRGWIGFNGRYWDLRDGEALARRWAHKVSSGLIAQGKYFEERGIKWMDFVTKAGSAGASSAMLAQAQSYLVADLEDFDPDPLALNVANGVLRFCYREDGSPGCDFEARHDPADRMTRIAAAPFVKDAKRPLFDKLLAEAQPIARVRGYLAAVFGYTATGATKEQLFVILQGKGGDGKSTLVGVVRETLGSYAVSAGIETFLDTGVKRGGDASPDVARLAGDTRLISTGEPPRGSKLATSAIKSFTGGAPIVARELRMGIFEFKPTGKVVLECNGKPAINDTDDGIWRRMAVVLFKHQIPKAQQDPNLPDKLKAEMPGVLGWLVAGVLAWMKDGLVAPAEVEAAVDDYRKGSNPFGEWWADQVIVDPEARVRASELFRAYKDWCDQQGHERPMTQTTFGRALGDLQVIRDGKNGAGDIMRRGARLRPPDATPPQPPTPFDDPHAEPSEFEVDR